MGNFQLKLRENQKVNLITDASILKVREINKIRELCMVVSKFRKLPSGIELRKKRRIEIEWESLEESKGANSADRIGQLTALRFEMQTGNMHLSRRNARKFRKMKWRVWGKKF